MNASQLTRIADDLTVTLGRDRAPDHNSRGPHRIPWGEVGGGREAHVAAREGHSSYRGDPASRSSRQIPRLGGASEGAAMNASPQFKVGLAMVAATAIGSLLYHLFF